MAEIPLFFYPEKLQTDAAIVLPEEQGRHVAQVLRMRAGEAIALTDGKGNAATGIITELGKKRVAVQLQELREVPRRQPGLQLAVAFTRNASRNEWLLEKATELGLQRITPLIAQRSIRERFRADRWHNILVSAMLQSRQYWLPQLDEPTDFEAVLNQAKGCPMFIAHCMEDAAASPRIPILAALKKGQNACIFIGPEGDFNPAELTLAIAAGAVPISLGSNRLRTETAALSAVTSFYLLHDPSAL